jgi:hypothetical protein
MSTIYLPDATEVGAIINACAEKGVYAEIARGVAHELREALPPWGAKLAAEYTRRVVESAEFRAELAVDALARLGRPVVEVDREALAAAMGDAAEAAVFALAEAALQEVGGR